MPARSEWETALDGLMPPKAARVLGAVLARPEGILQRDLPKIVGFPINRVQEAVVHLEEAGFVRRKVHQAGGVGMPPLLIQPTRKAPLMLVKLMEPRIASIEHVTATLRRLAEAMA